MDKKFGLIKVDVFYRDLIVCFGNKGTLKKALLRYHDEEETNNIIDDMEFDGNEKGKVYYNKDNNAFVLWFYEKPKNAQDMGFLSHEIFHAASVIMDDIGARPALASEEVYAYIITFLTERILTDFSISSFHEPETM